MAANGLPPNVIERWRNDGIVVVPGLLGTIEIENARVAFDALFAASSSSGAVPPATTQRAVGAFRLEQFSDVRAFPFYSTPELNLLGCHPHLLETVKQLLGADDVFMYMNYAWAKFAGEADYNQAHHLDYPTHSLLVPSTDLSFATVNCFIYLTDVSDDTGATRYVRRPQTTEFALHRALPDDAAQHVLMGREISAAGPAGSLLLYRTDVYHRGTNLTRPGGIRYVLGTSYRRADAPWAGANAWLTYTLHPAWQDIFEHATPDQLAALGVPRPGHPYWTRATIEGVEARYARWDSTPWWSAAGLGSRPRDGAVPKLEWPPLDQVPAA